MIFTFSRVILFRDWNKNWGKPLFGCVTRVIDLLNNLVITISSSSSVNFITSSITSPGPAVLLFLHFLIFTSSVVISSPVASVYVVLLGFRIIILPCILSMSHFSSVFYNKILLSWTVTILIFVVFTNTAPSFMQIDDRCHHFYRLKMSGNDAVLSQRLIYDTDSKGKGI